MSRVIICGITRSISQALLLVHRELQLKWFRIETGDLLLLISAGLFPYVIKKFFLHCFFVNASYDIVRVVIFMICELLKFSGHSHCYTTKSATEHRVQFSNFVEPFHICILYKTYMNTFLSQKRRFGHPMYRFIK